MMNKLGDKVTRNLKISGKKRKIDDFKIEQEELSIYENPSKNTRQNKCDICSKIYCTNSYLKQHIESVHEGKTFKSVDL